jgi:hypothetical protein
MQFSSNQNRQHPMKKNILQLLALAIFLSLPVLFMTGCYNDSKEYLYPELSGDCDTTNVTFALSVKPIIDGNCTSCHSGNSPSGGLNIENYDQTKALADDGRLVNVINAANGYQLMPQGGALPDCSIKTIEIWVAAGAPNN